ncbi:morphogenic membrane protein MmpB [Kitasatospora sp. HPMI-4]
MLRSTPRDEPPPETRQAQERPRRAGPVITALLPAAGIVLRAV